MKPEIKWSRRGWLASMAGLAGLFAQQGVTSPNVVLIVADDLGWGDVGMNGCPDIRTPHIDSLAKHGVRFTQAYSNGPECTPTRCALLTGRYQQRVGGLECAIGSGNVGRYDEAVWLRERCNLGLPVEELTMPQLFKQWGYDTAIFGKWHLGYEPKFHPNRHGFDEFFGFIGWGGDYFKHVEDLEAPRPVLMHNQKFIDREGYATDLFADAAVQWLKSKIEPRRPFFLYLPFTSPHTPIQDPDKFNPKTGTAPVEQGNREAFVSMVERLDTRIGDILSELDRMGVKENTIVWFISDNGADANGRNDPWRGRKGGVYEGGIRVASALRWPGHVSPGSVTDQVTLTMDFLPTIAHALAQTLPRGRNFDGIDLTPVLLNRQASIPRTVFWRLKRAENIRKAVRAGEWKLVVNNGEAELYHLPTEPREKTQAENPDRKKELLLALTKWEREVEPERLREYRKQSSRARK